MNAAPRSGPRILLALSVLAIALATLTPSSSSDSPSGFCFLCGERGAADLILNLLLFLPFGFALRLLYVPPLRAFLLCGAVAFGIESAQFTIIPGRDASAMDVLTNTVGAVFGYFATSYWLKLVHPPRSRARRLVVVSLVVLAALPALFAFAMQPSVRSKVYFPQWTPRIRNETQYRGQLYEVRSEGRLIGRRASEHSAAIERLVIGKTFDLYFIAAAPIRGRSTLFAFANDEKQHLLRIAIENNDLLVTWRTRSRDLRFDSPTWRLRRVLNGIQAGDTVHLRVTRSTGYIHAMSASRQAEAPLRASHAWMVLHAAIAPFEARQLISDVFLVMLFFPVGYWAATAKWAAAPLGAITTFLAGSWLVGLAGLTVEELLVCLVASGAGYVRATAFAASQRGSGASELT